MTPRPWKPKRDRVCVACGWSFWPTGPNCPRCPECQVPNKRRRWNALAGCWEAYSPASRRRAYEKAKADPERLARHREVCREAGRRFRERLKQEKEAACSP